MKITRLDVPLAPGIDPVVELVRAIVSGASRTIAASREQAEVQRAGGILGWLTSDLFPTAAGLAAAVARPGTVLVHAAVGLQRSAFGRSWVAHATATNVTSFDVPSVRAFLEVHTDMREAALSRAAKVLVDWQRKMQPVVAAHPELRESLLNGEQTTEEIDAIATFLRRGHGDVFPTRMRNWADRRGLKSVRDIVALENRALLREGNLGKKTLAIIQEQIRCATGRTWDQLRELAPSIPEGQGGRVSSPSVFTPAGGAKAWSHLRGTFPQALRKTPLNRLNLSARLRNMADARGLKFIDDFLALDERELMQEPNFGRGSLKVLIELLNEFATRLQADSGTLPTLEDFDSWLTLLRTALSDLQPVDAMVITRRTGLDGNPTATLAELGDELGVSRERARQLQARGAKQLAGTWWPDELRACVAPLVADGAAALDVLAQVPFFTDADEYPDVFEFLLNDVLGLDIHLVKVDECLLLSKLKQDAFDEFLAAIRREIRRLQFPVSESEVSQLVQERCSALGVPASLILSFVMNDLSSRQTEHGTMVDGFGGKRETEVLAYLRASPTPVPVADLEARFGRGRIPEDALYVARGVVGLAQHVPDFDLWTKRLVPLCKSLLLQDPARQWSTMELVDLLAEQVRLPSWFSGWHLASIIRVDKSIRYLGRLRVALDHTDAPTDRAFLRDMLLKILEDHGRPMPRQTLLDTIRNQSACSDLIFGMNVLNVPFVPMNDEDIGLIARDLPGGLDAMNQANELLVAQLERTQQALSSTTALIYLQTACDCFAQWTPSVVSAVARLPGMLVLSRSGSIGLNGWSAEKFPSRQGTVRELLDTHGGEVPVNIVKERLESHFGVALSRQKLVNLAATVGACIRGDSVVDQRVLATRASLAPSDYPDPLDVDGFPTSAVDAFLQACLDPNEDIQELRDAVDAHVVNYMKHYERDPRLAPEEAHAVAQACHRFLDRAESGNAGERRVAVAVARYFVLRHDAENDFEVGGLDDDIAVANAMATHLGFQECRVALTR